MSMSLGTILLLNLDWVEYGKLFKGGLVGNNCVVFKVEWMLWLCKNGLIATALLTLQKELDHAKSTKFNSAWKDPNWWTHLLVMPHFGPYHEGVSYTTYFRSQCMFMQLCKFDVGHAAVGAIQEDGYKTNWDIIIQPK